MTQKLHVITLYHCFENWLLINDFQYRINFYLWTSERAREMDDFLTMSFLHITEWIININCEEPISTNIGQYTDIRQLYHKIIKIDGNQVIGSYTPYRADFNESAAADIPWAPHHSWGWPQDASEITGFDHLQFFLWACIKKNRFRHRSAYRHYFLRDEHVEIAQISVSLQRTSSCWCDL